MYRRTRLHPQSRKTPASATRTVRRGACAQRWSSRGEGSVGGHSRSGSIVPIIVMSLLVVMLLLALVLDRIWLDAAQIELQTTAEMSALAAATELVSDELLKPVDPDHRFAHARQQAARLAQLNLVAGRGVQLDVSQKGDIRFGRRIVDEETGRSVFVETDNGPTHVLVRAHRTRQRNNPVAMVLSSLDGTAHADMVEQAEARIDNLIYAFRPQPNLPIPLLPLAIRARKLREANTSDSTGNWADDIEGERVQDKLGYDRPTREVLRQPDGIPEMELVTLKRHGKRTTPNVALLEFAGSFSNGELSRQIHFGLSSDDLVECDGQLNIHQHTPWIGCSLRIGRSVVHELQSIIGEPRLVVLYEEVEIKGRMGHGRLRCAGVAAVRILKAAAQADGSVCLTVQPTVMTTRTAVLADELTPEETSALQNPVAANRYVYKLQLTR